MSKTLSRIAGFVLVLGWFFAPPGWARYPDDWEVNEKINRHDFTFTEQVLPGRDRMATGTLGYAFLLSNCPMKGCVTLSGTYNIVGEPYITTLSVEGSDCRPTLEAVDVNGMVSRRIILTVPSNTACAGVPRTASGEYFPICHWDAPGGNLSWTGAHKNYRCWTESGKLFPLGPR